MTETQTASPEAKTTKKLAAKKTVAKTAPKTATKPAKAAAKIVKAKPAKPSVPLHSIKSNWSGVSDVANLRTTRTPIAVEKFGKLIGAAMTDRDRKALQALRNQFKQGEFTRANIDAGILRRLGERGFLTHVSGSNVAADAKFKLTTRAFTKEAMNA